MPRRQRADEEAVVSDDGDLTDEEGEWSDEEEEEDYDVDEGQEQSDGAQASNTQILLVRPPPPLGEHVASPRSILREPGSAPSSPDERRLLLATKMPSYSGGTSDSDSGRLRRATLGSAASPRAQRLSTLGRRKSMSKPPRGSSSFGQTVSCWRGSYSLTLALPTILLCDSSSTQLRFYWELGCFQSLWPLHTQDG
jgi:hypothetical protein